MSSTTPRIVPAGFLSRVACGTALAATALTYSASASAQIIFSDDFGNSATRVASPYVPQNVTNPYLFTMNNVPDGYYAILRPQNLAAEGAASYWHGIPSDHTTAGTTWDGAALVLNAGLHLNQFYRRNFVAQSGTSYRISAWQHTVTYNTIVQFELQEVNDQAQLGVSADFATSDIDGAANPSKNDWQLYSYEFRVDGCGTGPLDMAVSIRNRKSLTSGNDLLLDDVVLEQIPNNPALPAIACPTQTLPTVTANNDSAPAPAAGGSVTIDVGANDTSTGGAPLLPLPTLDFTTLT